MLGRTRIHTRARGSGAGAGATADLQRLLALSPSLVVWPALATMTVATDGTGAAPAPGQVVGRILDLSGNGNNLIAGTWASPSDAARATYQNGAISFNGSANYYSLLSAISITTDMTVVRAFKRAGAGIRSVGLGAIASSNPREFFWQNSNVQSFSLSAATKTISGSSTTTGSFVSTVTRNVSQEIARLNGAQIDAQSASAVSGSFTALGNVLTNLNNGEISLLAVFTDELIGSDLALVEQIAAATNGSVLS